MAGDGGGGGGADSSEQLIAAVMMDFLGEDWCFFETPRGPPGEWTRPETVTFWDQCVQVNIGVWLIGDKDPHLVDWQTLN